MIRGESRRTAILDSFPAVKAETYTEIEQDVLPHYVFYKATGKTKKECFCTHCRQWYIKKESYEPFDPVAAHKSLGKCKNCGHEITYIAAGRGRGLLSSQKNVCILKAVGDDLYIRCFSASQRFIGKENIPEVGYRELHRYYLSKGECQHWHVQWRFIRAEGKTVKEWYAMKSENEPIFDKSFTYAEGRDNSYTVIGDEELDKTFLKHSQVREYSNYAKGDRGLCKFIKYICFYAKHQNAEHLINAGFTGLIHARMQKESRCYINWRSNDLKKMLGLNKPEIKLLKGWSDYDLADYKIFRKLVPNASPEECKKITLQYQGSLEEIKEIIGLTGISFEQVCNYYEKQVKTSRHVLTDWRDYLRECQKLEYDLHDTMISKPKNLAKAHERTSELITIQKNEKTDKAIMDRVKELNRLVATDEEKGLTIVLPTCVQDFISEGKLLKHCVGGYAERHAKGETTVVFVRKISKPNKPYYTLQISNDGRIVQNRGYRNNQKTPKPKVMKEFEEEYQVYLDGLYKKKTKNLRKAV